VVEERHQRHPADRVAQQRRPKNTVKYSPSVCDPVSTANAASHDPAITWLNCAIATT